MNNVKFFLILSLLFLFSMNTASAGDLDSGGWVSNSSVVNGLPSVNNPTPTVFYYNDVWKLISGNNAGTFTGYNWTGTTWQVDSDIISGLGDIGTFSAPAVFNDGGTLKLIAGDGPGNFFGFYWSGSAWIPDSSIVSGLVDVGDRSTPTVFYDSGTWKLIAGEYDGLFNGYYWSGSAWVPDSSVVSGLSDIGYNSAPTVFNDAGTLRLIAGEQHFVFNGYYWSGSTWVSDPGLVAGLPTSGYDTLTPAVYEDSGTWKLISGEDTTESFLGYQWVITPETPVSLSNVYSYTWVNWTWAPGTSGTYDTDSYNVSINGSWTNGSSNTYYNHNLPSGGTSTIFVWGYNSSNNVLSYESATDSKSTTSLPPAGVWESNSSVVTGLGDIGTWSAPTVFDHSDIWKLITGELGGNFFGYEWNGTSWVSNSSIVTGLTDVGDLSTLTVFNDSGTLKLIAGETDGVFNGYYWSGSAWVSDSSVVTGLGDIGYDSAPTVFNDGGTWKLISGDFYGNFHGFYWSGSAWIPDSSIVTGLPDIGTLSKPTVFDDSGTLKLISGESSSGGFFGYYWSGSAWVSDSSVVDGLESVGTRSAPTVYDDSGIWKLISGEFDGVFNGYQLTPTASRPATPVLLNGAISESWVYWTWVLQSLDSHLDTDSYNVSINGSWTNGSSNTYYNHNLGSFGTSTIIVWAYNSTDNILSYESVTDTEYIIPTYIPPDPINLANSTHNLRVNYTFEIGTGDNITDSFNISTNNGAGIVWNNDSSNLFSNTSTSAHGYIEIVVYAHNNSGAGTLSTGYLTDNVTIPNNPVTITDIVNYSISEYELLFIDVNVTDIDSDTPTFSCNRTDLFSDFSSVTGQCSWTPGNLQGGTYHVDFGVSDGHGSTDNQTAVIIVADTVNPYPSSQGINRIVWHQISDYPGTSTITQGTTPSFVIGRKGYAIANNQEVWEFDVDSGSWSQKADSLSVFEYPVYLTINDNGYVIGGTEGGDITGKVREYIPSTNTWNEDRTNYTIPGGATNVVLPVIEDGYVFELAPNTNYSTPGPLRVGAHRRAYLKYNISSIPSSGKITEMKQYIYWSSYCSLCGLEGSPTYSRKTTSDWSSSTLTWNNQPSVQTSSDNIYFHMAFNEPSLGGDIIEGFLQDSIDNGDSWYGTQITSFNEQSHLTDSDYGELNSIEECVGCSEYNKGLLPGSQIVIDWVPKIPLMAASFVIGDRGYTLSADGNLQSYDQFSDLWRDHSSIPSYGVYPNRAHANVTWAISFNGKGYVLVGDTMWEYTPSGDDWTEMSSSSHFNSLQYPAGFIIEDTIFVGTGLLDGTKTASMFSFHPATDTWTLESTSFPSARSRAIVFSVDNDEGYTNIYMGGGIGSILQDFYEMSFAYTTPRSTPIVAVVPTYLPTPDDTPELPIPEEELTFIEEVLLFISTAFSWLFILAAYVGAFASSSILIREIEDFEEIKYDILLFGTLGWVVPLFINFTGLVAIVTESFLLNAIIFAAFGFVVYTIGNAFSKD